MDINGFFEAVCQGDVVRAAEALDAHPELVNQDDQHAWRPIFHAGLRRHYDMVKLLIDRGADLSAHDGYVMHYAGEVPDNKRVVALLVQYGGLDAHTRPASDAAREFIHAVFLANDIRVAALLRSNPALATETYARGDGALHHACRNGDAPVVALLLQHGADVNALNGGGHFPLYCAAGHCHVETTALLLQHGADVGQTMQDGKTVAEWMRQYVDRDPRFRPCLELVERHAV